MGKINKKALLFSFVLTVICGVVLFNYISSMKTPVAERPKTDIFVSVRDILPGEIVLPTDLKVASVSTDSVPEGILIDKADIENMVVRERIMAGEPFRESRLTTAEKMAFSYDIPYGMRAVSIFVSETSVISNMLRVGDHVDIISIFPSTSEDGETYANNTYNTLENIEVAAIGNDRFNLMDQSIAGGAAATGVDDMPRAITVYVTPEDAERLTYILSFGEMYLTLRSHGDGELAETPGAILKDIMPEKSITDAATVTGTSEVVE